MFDDGLGDNLCASFTSVSGGRLDQESYVAPKINPWIIAGVVALAAFMEVLDTSIASVALPNICGGLGASIDEGNWILTSYLVSNAVVLPAGSWASSVLGRKNFFLLCIALFTVSSFFCGIAPSLPLLLLFRVLQGAGGGGLIPVAQAIISDSFPPEKRSLAFAFFGVVVVLAPSIGPTLGGWITDAYSWRWIFFINIPVGLLALFLNHRLLTDPPTSKGDVNNLKTLDTIGFGFLVVSMGSLQILFDKGEEKGWLGSTYIIRCTIIFVISIVGLIYREWTCSNPLIKLKLLKNNNFAISCVLMVVLGAVLNSGITLLPLLEQTFLGYTATLAGLSVTLAGVSLLGLFALAGIAMQKIQARFVTAFGFAIIGIGFWFSSTLITSQSSFWTLSFARFYQTAGIAFLFTSITTAVYVGMAAEDGSQVSGITNLIRNIGGSVGISLANAAVTERAEFHQAHLVGGLTSSSPLLQDFVLNTTQRLTQFGSNQVDARQMAYGVVDQMIRVQANVLAYAEVYRLIGLGCCFAFFVAFLLKKNTPGEGEAHGH